MNTRRPIALCGSALVLVLWCIMLLSLAVFAVVEMVSLSADHATFEQSMLEAQAWAASGAALGQVPQLLVDDPILRRMDTPGHGYSVTLSTEAARLNLNYVLLTNHRDVLLHLFTAWGMKMHDAQHAADSLYDWVTPGDLASLNGAKAEAYAEAGLPQRPTHQPFQSWQEVGQVMGMDAVAAAKPDWQNNFTLWSDGPLDLTVASAECMAAVFGVADERAAAVVKLRNGRDGLPGTSDDAPLSASIIKSEFALTDLQLTALSNQYVFGSTVRRIESVGQAGTAYAHVFIVTRLNVNPPQYLVWSER